MKISLYGLHRGAGDPEVLTRRARAAEAAGFDGLWIGDHVALPVEWGGLQDERVEAVTALTFLAAVTSTIRLTAGVIVLPQRQPVLLAKQLASVDHLSQGRLSVGIGVGYIEAELYALGARLDERGSRTDECLAAMTALWSDEVPSFRGRWLSFTDVVQRPLPVQRPHPPIIVGGHSAAAHRRALRVGQGWFGWMLDVPDTQEALANLRDHAPQVDRSSGLGRLEISVAPPGEVDVELVHRYQDLGVDRLVLVPPSAEGSAPDDFIAAAGSDLIPAV